MPKHILKQRGNPCPRAVIDNASSKTRSGYDQRSGIRTGLERVAMHMTYSVCSSTAGGTVQGGGIDNIKWSHRFFEGAPGMTDNIFIYI